MSDNQQIVNPYPFNFFAAIPWVLFGQLTPDEGWLYAHYVRVAGFNGGKCFEAVKTTAEQCRMTDDRVRKARNSLANLGLIEVKEQRKEDGSQGTLLITLCPQVWQQNARHFKAVVVENGGGYSENQEGGYSENQEGGYSENQEGGTPKNRTQSEIESKRKNLSGDANASQSDTPATPKQPLKEKKPRVTNPHFEFVYELVTGKPYKPMSELGQAEKASEKAYAGRVSAITRFISEIPIDELRAFHRDYKRWTSDSNHPEGLAFPLDGFKIQAAFTRWQQSQATTPRKPINRNKVV